MMTSHLKGFFTMLTSKKIWKPSRFKELPVPEYNKISIKAFWLESLVHNLVTLKKSFRGLETQVSDILFIIFFPIIFGFTIIAGPILLYYDKKKFKNFEREQGERIKNFSFSMSFYCLDWKSTFSKDITPESYVDY